MEAETVVLRLCWHATELIEVSLISSMQLETWTTDRIFEISVYSVFFFYEASFLAGPFQT